jgi:hypothetical protein
VFLYNPPLSHDILRGINSKKPIDIDEKSALIKTDYEEGRLQENLNLV